MFIKPSMRASEMNIKKSKGFTIVEVLVAMIILAIGVLGLGILQISSIQNTRGGQLRSQATILAYDIVDSMRANIAAVTAGNYNTANNLEIGSATQCYGAASNCSGQEMANADIDRWRTSVSLGLPPQGWGTVATIDNGNTTLATVTVNWADPVNPDGFEQLTLTAELLE
jgi:type IV pilus assembly protein PilV